MTFKNEFSWSQSRKNIFDECQRKYWWQYYGAWSGWKWNSSDKAKEAYRLKQVKTWQMWVGERVHETINDILKSIEKDVYVPSKNILVASLKTKMKREFEMSKSKPFFDVTPKKYLRLFEHEYDVPVKLEDATNRAELCMTNFYRARFIDKIKRISPSKIHKIQKFDTFDFEGTTVFTIPDFAYKEYRLSLPTGPTETDIIVDWKTGSPDKSHDFQLACYALYGMEKWKAPKIVLEEYYLQTNERTSRSINAIEIGNVKSDMRESISGMRELLTDNDNNVADMEKFGKTTYAPACERCKYQSICE